MKSLKYINASKVLPFELLQEVQKYVRGEILYVPGDQQEKAAWGEANGTREKYNERNSEIMLLYRRGMGISALSQHFHLSECSIKKILYKARKCEALDQAELRQSEAVHV